MKVLICQTSIFKQLFLVTTVHITHPVWTVNFLRCSSYYLTIIKSVYKLNEKKNAVKT